MKASVGTSFVLGPDTVLRYLERRGIDVRASTATLLSGGVSGVVVAIDGPDPLVVKQALPRLLVAAEWTATVQRAVTEARALDLFHRITPANVPELRDADSENFALTMSRAPSSWPTWKELLLRGAGERDGERGRQIGEILGTWHAATWLDASLREGFSDDLAFEQLRLDPFHRTILRQRPELGRALQTVIDELGNRRQCLVHGDFSPKNILVGDDGLWVIDFEVTRFGAAVFDPAFLVSHLMLKAFHDPASALTLRAVSEAFLDGYADRNPAASLADTIGWHIAALLLARVDGKSPAGYLTDGEADRVRRVAIGLLAAERPTIEELWSEIVASAREQSR